MAKRLKRKGAYEYQREWHQNQSAMVIPMAAEAALVRGESIREFICSPERDLMDFMLRAKIPRSSRLVGVDNEGVDRPLQNVTRYYVSTEGVKLVKIMPPLKKDPEKWRRIGIQSGWLCHPCNKLSEIGPPVNHDYYIQEAEKLVLGLR